MSKKTHQETHGPVSELQCFQTELKSHPLQWIYYCYNQKKQYLAYVLNMVMLAISLQPNVLLRNLAFMRLLLTYAYCTTHLNNAADQGFIYGLSTKYYTLALC